AVFVANVNWTLEIQDVNTNTVRTATGSGGSMLFAWDGAGQGGTNLPVGTYTYLITVQTNGQELSSPSGAESASSASSASTSGDSEGTQLWVQQADGSIVPLAIYPPGIDTSDFNIFEAPLSWNP